MGLAPWKAGQVLGDVHIGIESLRNNVAHMHFVLSDWLERVIDFDYGTPAATRCPDLWHLLGVPAHRMELFLEVQPCWANGALRVNPELLAEGKRSAMKKVRQVWALCMSWQKFTESRWCSIGIACRNCMRSITVGVDSLFECVKRRPGSSSYFYHGFARMDAQARAFIAVSALTSIPVESLLANLLSDDRIARRLSELEDLAHTELSFLDRVPIDVWDHLASAAEMPAGSELRSAVLQGAYASIGHVRRGVFDQFKVCPWRLTQGDIDSNLSSLANEDIAALGADPTTLNIYRMLKSGRCAEFSMQVGSCEVCMCVGGEGGLVSRRWVDGRAGVRGWMARWVRMEGKAAAIHQQNTRMVFPTRRV